jgi:hypothetical protein
MKWGLLDTEDMLWMGDDEGPVAYESEEIAKVAAQMCDARLGWRPGQCRARTFRGDCGTPWSHR